MRIGLTAIVLALTSLGAVPASGFSYSEDYWRSSDILTKRFVCASEGGTPDWCAELPGEVEVPASIAGELAARAQAAAERAAMEKAAQEVLAARQGVIDRIRSGKISEDDVAKLLEQAKEGENEAMELIAWMYANELTPGRKDSDELNELAYIWYGRAFLAGAKEVKVNMDKIWPTLNETQQRRIIALFDKTG